MSKNLAVSSVLTLDILEIQHNTREAAAYAFGAASQQLIYSADSANNF